MKPEMVKEMQIPKDIESAVLDLKGLGELATATEWQRAAIVYAFTYEGKPGGRKSTDQECSVAKSLDEFAKLGLAGLGSRTTVRKYRAAWKLAVHNGVADSEVFPGGTITLPEVDWDEYFSPPKPPREPAEPKKAGKAKAKAEESVEDEAEPASDEPGSHGVECGGLDSTNPKNKRVQTGLSLLTGVEPKHTPERFRGGVTRLKKTLNDLAKPDANHQLMYLHMCQALADLVHVLNEEDAGK